MVNEMLDVLATIRACAPQLLLLVARAPLMHCSPGNRYLISVMQVIHLPIYARKNYFAYSVARVSRITVTRI